ncbi:MAG TPA: hypothetical protein PL033_21035 [Candidatus Brocadiia bacterium]|nr:hypothetical protein [Candidatus Brocadiia bacterium]
MSAPRLSGWARSLAVILLITTVQGQGADESSGKELLDQLEPGAMFSLEVVEPAPTGSANPWTVRSQDNQTIMDHAGTGLRVIRRSEPVRGTSFARLETTVTNCGNVPVVISNIRLADLSFRGGAIDQNVQFKPLVYRADTWYGSTYWTGPDWTRVGRDWHHPGENTPSIRTFTTPKDGRIKISGRIYKADTNGGDGVCLRILRGAIPIWKAEIGPSDTTGVEPNVNLEVKKGETVRFVVHKRGQIFCDTTHWDPLITYDSGESFQASKQFSAQQNENGWSYEMDEGDQGRSQSAYVRGFDRNMIPVDAPLEPNGAVSLDSERLLPIWLVSDISDQSGIVMGASLDEPWHFEAKRAEDGRFLVTVRLAVGSRRMTIEKGKSLRLPPLALGSYRGGRTDGIRSLQQFLSHGAHDALSASLNELVVKPLTSMSYFPLDMEKLTGQPIPMDLVLWTMVLDDWRRQDGPLDTPDACSAAIRKHLRATDKVLTDLQATHPSKDRLELNIVSASDGKLALPLWELQRLYIQVRGLKRRIILSSLIQNSAPVLFCKRMPTSYSHLVMQYFGWRARPGGGLFILEKPGISLQTRDILQGKLAGGNILEPRLSYDAKRIVFSFVRCRSEPFVPEQLDNASDDGFYHVYEVNVDGTELRQITSGPYDDVMPCYLPDGGIVFSSTRRKGYARCFGPQFSPRWHVYTLHRVDSDGANLRTLSFHDTNEWFPTVGRDGLILYSRWDYIDRDAVTHQNLWSTRPDGANPATVWGNATPTPHCAFQAQPIPGSQKIIFTASAHHSITGGSIVILDPTVDYDGGKALTRITPEIPFPEAESGNIAEYYASPSPLSDKHFLVSYSPTALIWEPGPNQCNALGIYLLDIFGNRELIYRDGEIGSDNPCLLSPRQAPPVLPSLLPPNAPPTGEMELANVYQGLGAIPQGAIRRLRIIQILPKTTPVANAPRIGVAMEENTRAILGTVPVEPDGSARFIVPAQKPILFQALDENGMALQTMRTVTYLQPGEKVSCIGCHENRMTAVPNRRSLEAKRPPSLITEGPLDGKPFSYMLTVQPILDKHCIRCHGGSEPKNSMDLTAAPLNGFTKSYWSLCGNHDFQGLGTNPETAAKALVPRFGARNQIQVTPPGGLYGSHGSRLIRMLRKGHQDVKLSSEDVAQLSSWVDCNANFYGVYSPEEQARQLRGEAVPMPEVQ